VGLDSRGAGRVVRCYSAEAELVDLRYRLVGTERFLRRVRPKFPRKGKWQRLDTEHGYADARTDVRQLTFLAKLAGDLDELAASLDP
jgi:hypothetical protein